MNPSIALSHCQLKTGKELYSKKLQQFYIHSVITGGRESQKKKKNHLPVRVLSSNNPKYQKNNQPNKKRESKKILQTRLTHHSQEIQYQSAIT